MTKKRHNGRSARNPQHPHKAIWIQSFKSFAAACAGIATAMASTKHPRQSLAATISVAEDNSVTVVFATRAFFRRCTRSDFIHEALATVDPKDDLRLLVSCGREDTCLFSEVREHTFSKEQNNA